MFKIFITTIILNLSLFSTNLEDIANIYIQKGDEKTLTALQKLVENNNFWLSYIQDSDVKYGYYENKNHIILSNRQKKEVTIYEIHNKKITLYKKTNALFGFNEGDKQFEGDKKTPIGVYDFLARLDKKNKLADKYGPLAFVTTYPNLADKLLYKKTGHGIWIHGKPYNNTSKTDTLGCIALDNEEIAEIDKKLDFKKTILIIATKEYATTTKVEISNILANLHRWKNAWKNNDFETYISFYDNAFRRYDGSSLNKFSRYKSKLFSRKQKKQIIFTNVNITPYFNGQGEKLFKINFFEKYNSSTFKFNGVKNLYIKFINNSMKILVEE